MEEEKGKRRRAGRKWRFGLIYLTRMRGELGKLGGWCACVLSLVCLFTWPLWCEFPPIEADRPPEVQTKG